MLKSIYYFGEAIADCLIREGIVHTTNITLGGSQVFSAIGTVQALQELNPDNKIQVQFVSGLSNDEHGESFRKHLTNNGVRTDFVQDSAWPTIRAVVTHRPDNNEFYFKNLSPKSDLALSDETLESLYVRTRREKAIAAFGSISSILAPTAESYYGVAEYLKLSAQENALIYYDLNTRPSVYGSPDAHQKAVLEWAGFSDVVRASNQDIKLTYGTSNFKDIANLWFSRNVTIAIFTLGENGLVAYHRDSADPIIFKPFGSRDYHSTVGAGDNATAGLLAFLASSDCFSRTVLRRKANSDFMYGMLASGHEAAVRHLERLPENKPSLRF